MYQHRPVEQEKRTITFLSADTGGGHRSAANAIVEALGKYHGDRPFDVSVVDIFKDYAPRPLNRTDKLYTGITKTPLAWQIGYQMTDSRRRAQMLHQAVWPYIRRSAHDLLRDSQSDLLVSVHFASNALLRALGPRRPSYMTVVTDLVTTHALWYDRRVDECLVPTEAARSRAIECGLASDQVHTVGLPVPAAFVDPPDDWLTLRQRLGWPVDKTVVLLVGGGDGVGPVFELARAVAGSGLPIALAVVAGRNDRLRQRLEAQDWAVPTFVYGFTRDMPGLMAASDVLLSKAGPGTISEAFQMGLPMILYHCLPGQEEGNVQHVLSGGAGFWAPRTGQVIDALHSVVGDSHLRRRLSDASAALAQPAAARVIADRVAAWAMHGAAQSWPVS